MSQRYLGAAHPHADWTCQIGTITWSSSASPESNRPLRQFTGTLEDRIGNRGQVAVNAFQVPQNVEMQRTRIDRLRQPLSNPRKVTLDGVTLAINGCSLFAPTIDGQDSDRL